MTVSWYLCVNINIEIAKIHPLMNLNRKTYLLLEEYYLPGYNTTCYHGGILYDLSNLQDGGDKFLQNVG
jgi:hypothetical protein